MEYSKALVVLLAMFFCVFIQLFEGMKAFFGVDGKARLFRPMENMKRLNRSAVTMSLPVSDVLFCTTVDNQGKVPTHTVSHVVLCILCTAVACCSVTYVEPMMCN